MKRVLCILAMAAAASAGSLAAHSLDHGPKLNVVYVGTQSTSPMMFTQTRTYGKR